MKRRNFLKSGSCSLAAAFSATLVASDSKSLSVTDFGADNSGSRDSCAAIRSAIASAKAQRAKTLIFPHGTYRLMPDSGIAIYLGGLTDLEIDGRGSSLIMAKDARCISIEKSSAVSIHDFSIDYQPLPFVQGTVTASGLAWFSLALDSGFEMPAASMTVLAFGSYDRATRVLTKPPLESYGDVLSLDSIGPSTVKAVLKRPIIVPQGTVLVIRFKGTHNAVGINYSENINVRALKIFSSYSSALNATKSKNLLIEDTLIGFPDKSNRLLSSNSDGMDFYNCGGGSLSIRGCTLEGMGDDGVNVATDMWRVDMSAGAEPRIVDKSGKPIHPTDLSSPGASLEIVDRAKFHSQGTASAVTSGSEVHIHQDKAAQIAAVEEVIAFDPGLTPTVQVSGCDFKGNRARGIIVTKDAKIENCTFRNTTLSAILIAPDFFYREGPLVRNITIDSSRFSDCHYGSKDPEGSITIDVMHTYARRDKIAAGAAHDIVIQNNQFDTCPTAAIAARSVDNLVVSHNKFGPSWTGGDTASTPARVMILDQIRDSTISDNVSTARNAISIENSERVQLLENKGFTAGS